jgi:two-component system phosphate regulon sensor histidine kinase PhoR
MLVTVTDTGVGIPRAELPRVFERFYKVDRARTRNAGGTGLGLAIAKHLVEGHGGCIWAASEEGQGSTFYFVLPTAR